MGVNFKGAYTPPKEGLAEQSLMIDKRKSHSKTHWKEEGGHLPRKEREIAPTVKRASAWLVPVNL
jgi:hypothetical protein